MSAALRLVGFEELSAGVLRARLLARRGSFWSGSVLTDEELLALHDPLFFHQLGGFGAVALTQDDADAGYLLGVVSADRLGVVHAVAVHPDHRGRGLAGRLLQRFAGLAAGAGARVVQAVARPDDVAARGLAEHCGAVAAPSPGHAGPGADRTVYTLPLRRG
ncbi:GNAT family N-acetyltransferase [Blastococcus sp. TML/M2B]|uniref:GNAT family N-acetyltransferase n=1 Tax=unclassified Blastococcus TaxID=2619396 RepID=UPI00190A4E88|nr:MULTISPECIES: GNAT family N-acetyltransferase [unclassified Blastococcus]MBN1093484.1 GNAT family N-acetyltransferase [Blastococcus sp. TML/M2B]MBN1096399.1 GNAT family N-acetyltransferase [Blastococcus sp. TML/C7B]